MASGSPLPRRPRRSRVLSWDSALQVQPPAQALALQSTDGYSALSVREASRVATAVCTWLRPTHLLKSGMGREEVRGSSGASRGHGAAPVAPGGRLGCRADSQDTAQARPGAGTPGAGWKHRYLLEPLESRMGGEAEGTPQAGPTFSASPAWTRARPSPSPCPALSPQVRASDTGMHLWPSTTAALLQRTRHGLSLGCCL